PGKTAIGQQVPLDALGPLGALQSIRDNPEQVRGDDDPVERTHERRAGSARKRPAKPPEKSDDRCVTDDDQSVYTTHRRVVGGAVCGHGGSISAPSTRFARSG